MTSTPEEPNLTLDLKYVGEDHATKLMRTRQELENQMKLALVVAILDEVTWLFKLRGVRHLHQSHLPGYTEVTTNNAMLFVNLERVSQDGQAQPGQEVQLHLYDTFILPSRSSLLTFM